jgi:hypothetical protein
MIGKNLIKSNRLVIPIYIKKTKLHISPHFRPFIDKSSKTSAQGRHFGPLATLVSLLEIAVGFWCLYILYIYSYN